MKVGSRIRLTSKMVNPDSKWMPEEDIPVGSTGTVIWINNDSNPKFNQIGVNWDNGRSLCILPYIDKFEVIEKNNDEIETKLQEQ